jgi:Ycf66 protein N-terminus
MLTYILALMVIVASAGLYSATFVLPEVSRKNDLAWSGVGLFYGLVLWVCAGRITGGVLLGQMASVGLIGWLGWQTIESRWNETPEGDRVNTGKVKGWRDRITGLTQSETATKLKTQAQGAISKAQGAVQDLGVAVETGTESATEAVKAAAEAVKRADVPLKPEDFGNPPKAEIDMTAAKPAMKSFTKPAENPLGGLFDRAKGMATGLNAPKKNKEVYVRKGKDEAVKPEATKPAVPAPEMDDDFDFGDLEEPKAAKPTSVSISADDMTAMKPTSASIAETATEKASELFTSATDTVKSAADTVVEAVTEVVTEVVTEEAAEETAVEKAATVVDEFGDVIVEAVEKRMGDLS